MTETTARLRAVALAGLMVLSVIASTVAFSGTVAAAEINRGDNPVGTWNTTDGEGDVGHDGVVFQGEDDIAFTWVAEGSDSPYEPEELLNNDNTPLTMPIEEDQETTTYSDGGTPYTVIVRTPRISDHEFRLDSTGGDVVDGTVPTDEDDMTVWADYNFGQAEDLEITIRDDGDVEVTDLAIPNEANQTQTADTDGEVTFPVELDDLDSGDYTVELQGSDDLTHGNASLTSNFTISSADDVTLELDQTEVVTGDNVRFDIEGGLEGNYHVVSIDASDVAGDATEAFRNVGDTVRTGTVAGDAWALVEIDSGDGIGSIETDELRDTDLDVSVSDAIDTSATPAHPQGYEGTARAWNGQQYGDLSEADDASLTVTEGEISLENPTDSYVPGADVTVNGTVSASYDEVSVFARDQGDYERVEIGGDETIGVTEDAFEAEDVDLTEGTTGGNDILHLPGTYRFAVVAGDANGADRLSSTQVVRNVSDMVSLRVAEGAFEVNATVINGEVARGDQIEVSGYAPGGDEINVSFIGPRGTFDQYSGIRVQSDGTFSEENVRIGGNIRDRFRSRIVSQLTGAPYNADPDDAQTAAQNSISDGFSDLSNGEVIMSVGHKGRDGVMGNGQPPDVYEPITIHLQNGVTIDYDDVDGLAMLIYRINSNAASYTQGQVAERLLEQTTRATASDDKSQVFQFRLTDPRTTVDNVVGEAGVNGTVEVGSEMVVEGTTNRQPDQNSITVEVIDGPSRTDFDIVTTSDWGTDGQWNTTLDTEGLQPGTYTIEASDGDSADVTQFQLQEGPPGDGTTDTPTNETETPDTETATPTEEPVGTPANGTETADTDGQQGPGFGVTVALVALLAAALLAVRRDS